MSLQIIGDPSAVRRRTPSEEVDFGPGNTKTEAPEYQQGPGETGDLDEEAGVGDCLDAGEGLLLVATALTQASANCSASRFTGEETLLWKSFSALSARARGSDIFSCKKIRVYLNRETTKKQPAENKVGLVVVWQQC